MADFKYLCNVDPATVGVDQTYKALLDDAIVKLKEKPGTAAKYDVDALSVDEKTRKVKMLRVVINQLAKTNVSYANLSVRLIKCDDEKYYAFISEQIRANRKARNSKKKSKEVAINNSKDVQDSSGSQNTNTTSS